MTTHPIITDEMIDSFIDGFQSDGSSSEYRNGIRLALEAALPAIAEAFAKVADKESMSAAKASESSRPGTTEYYRYNSNCRTSAKIVSAIRKLGGAG